MTPILGPGVIPVDSPTGIDARRTLELYPRAAMAVYQNHALDSRSCMDFVMLAVGPDNSNTEPPPTLVGVNLPVAWAYQHVGYWNPQTGDINADP